MVGVLPGLCIVWPGREQRGPLGWTGTGSGSQEQEMELKVFLTGFQVLDFPVTMSTEATTACNCTSHKAWVAKRIHSFVGIVPLGIYLVLHLSRNISTLGGVESFDSAVRETWKNCWRRRRSRSR